MSPQACCGGRRPLPDAMCGHFQGGMRSHAHSRLPVVDPSSDIMLVINLVFLVLADTMMTGARTAETILKHLDMLRLELWACTISARTMFCNPDPFFKVRQRAHRERSCSLNLNALSSRHDRCNLSNRLVWRRPRATWAGLHYEVLIVAVPV